MSKPKAPPLLSICIPTYNRSKFLRVMLQALMPQTLDFQGQVEVWILDNASTDETQEVLAEFKHYRVLNVFRHNENLGPAKNIVYGPTLLANGEYSWVLGDHNLLRKHALSRLINRLSETSEPKLHYTNFRCATYPSHWPESAHGGFEGTYEYLADKNLNDETLPEWKLILKPETSIGTQSYAHIVPTQTWRDFWQNRAVGIDYTDASTTYPHTTMLTLTSIDKEVITIKEPTITIFNNAQSWSNPNTSWRVYFNGLPHLLEILSAKGISDSRISDFRNSLLYPNLETLIRQKIKKDSLIEFLLYCWRETGSKPEIRSKLTRRAINRNLKPMWDFLSNLLRYPTHYVMTALPKGISFLKKITK